MDEWMDGMGWDGMGWDGMGWDGMGWILTVTDIVVFDGIKCIKRVEDGRME